MTSNTTANLGLNRVLKEFERTTGLHGLQYEIRSRSDGDVLIIYLAHPTERFFGILEKILASVTSETLFPLRATLKRKSPENVLTSPESKLLLRVISESLTVSRHTFANDFFDRYITSVFGAEEQITSAGNHIVFGRRGSGKSTLLLYAMHRLAAEDLPHVWVDMQVYNQRDDIKVIIDILRELVEQLSSFSSNVVEASVLRERLTLMESRESTALQDIQALLPNIRRFLGTTAADRGNVTVFLDDFHVIDPALQPKLLGSLYSLTRGNRSILKISAIETMTKNWDPATRSGLEVPHDAQVIRLDYNLTMPEKALDHIENILDNHARFCGLPAISILTYKKAAIDRLVWVSAGVPRDALNVFAQAMIKASAEDGRWVTVTNINAAASEMADVKLRDLELDSSGAFHQAMALLEDIREFCIKEKKLNAFLVERKNDDPVFETILKLADLRLLHVINEGITVREAGQKYMALILDYAFYVGMRAAKSISLFNRDTAVPKYQELRKLPVFTGPARAAA